MLIHELHFTSMQTGAFGHLLQRYPRKDLTRDDILDALANAVTASRLKLGSATLPDDPPRD